MDWEQLTVKNCISRFQMQQLTLYDADAVWCWHYRSVWCFQTFSDKVDTGFFESVPFDRFILVVAKANAHVLLLCRRCQRQLLCMWCQLWLDQQRRLCRQWPLLCHEGSWCATNGPWCARTSPLLWHELCLRLLQQCLCWGLWRWLRLRLRLLRRHLCQWMTGFLSILNRQVLLLAESTVVATEASTNGSETAAANGSEAAPHGSEAAATEPEICCICQDAMIVHQQTLTPIFCGHVFHASCLGEWRFCARRLTCNVPIDVSIQCALAILYQLKISLARKFERHLGPQLAAATLCFIDDFACFSAFDNKEPQWDPDSCGWWLGPRLGGCGCILGSAIWCWYCSRCWGGGKRFLSFAKSWLQVKCLRLRTCFWFASVFKPKMSQMRSFAGPLGAATYDFDWFWHCAFWASWGSLMSCEKLPELDLNRNLSNWLSG